MYLGNPGTLVLSVDANGDVIYVTGVGSTGAHNGISTSIIDPTKFASGQDVSQIGNPAQLLNNREIPMNNFNILYTQNGRIGMGNTFLNPGNIPQAKIDIRPTIVDEKGFQVFTNDNFSAVPFYEMNLIQNDATGTLENKGLVINMGGDPVKRSTGLTVNSSAATGSNFGIEVFASGNGSPHQTNISGLFQSFGQSQGGNMGIDVLAAEGLPANIGGRFQAGQIAVNQVGVENTGVIAQSYGGQNSIGIRASAANGTNTNYAAHFTGDVYANGVIVSTSDINLKENIQVLTNANTVLNQLNPVTFNFKHDSIYGRMHMPASLQYGLIAQEVEPILPDLIKGGFFPAERDSVGNITANKITFKTMNYDGLISILVKGHQEQSLTIDSLQNSNDSLKIRVDEINNRLTQLENCLSGILPFLCQLSQQAIQSNTPETQQAIRSQLTVILENKETIILDQNVPNPFAEQTIINFSIPESVKSAQILFYNGLGSLINTVEVRERGLGSLTVFGSDLSSGTYIYTLVADGIIVSTKKMVKQ